MSTTENEEDTGEIQQRQRACRRKISQFNMALKTNRLCCLGTFMEAGEVPSVTLVQHEDVVQEILSQDLCSVVMCIEPDFDKHGEFDITFSQKPSVLDRIVRKGPKNFTRPSYLVIQNRQNRLQAFLERITSTVSCKHEQTALIVLAVLYYITDIKDIKTLFDEDHWGEGLLRGLRHAYRNGVFIHPNPDGKLPDLPQTEHRCSRGVGCSFYERANDRENSMMSNRPIRIQVGDIAHLNLFPIVPSNALDPFSMKTMEQQVALTRTLYVAEPGSWICYTTLANIMFMKSKKGRYKIKWAAATVVAAVMYEELFHMYEHIHAAYSRYIADFKDNTNPY